jgi:ribosomal protein S21
MVVVKKKKGESDEGLISRFRKKVLKSGVLNEMREDHHKKDSEKRKERKYRLRHENELKKRRNY